MNYNTWVVLADNNRARILEYLVLKDIKEIETLIDPQARLHGHDVLESRPGLVVDSGGRGRHALEPRTTPKEHEADVFAKKIAEYLEAGRSSNRYTKLAVIAAPQTLGRLRANLSSSTKKLVFFELDKDLCKEDISAISQYLKSG